MVKGHRTSNLPWFFWWPRSLMLWFKNSFPVIILRDVFFFLRAFVFQCWKRLTRPMTFHKKIYQRYMNKGNYFSVMMSQLMLKENFSFNISLWQVTETYRKLFQFEFLWKLVHGNGFDNSSLLQSVLSTLRSPSSLHKFCQRR